MTILHSTGLVKRKTPCSRASDRYRLEKLLRPEPSDKVVGKVTAEAARLTGLKEGTPVIAGCMDTIGASIGSGVMEQGKCFIIMGTAARVSGSLEKDRFDSRFMNCTHVLPNRWLYIGAINGVGSSLRWIRDTFCQMEQGVADLTGRDVYDLLTAQAPPGSKGLLFLGAAMLAGVSQGVYPDLSAAMERIVVPGRVFEPNGEAHAAYDRLYPMFRKLYTEVQHHFEELARMDLPQVWVTKENG